MNRALPQRDRRDRISDPRWASRSGRVVSGAGRLVGGVKATASAIRKGHRCATVGARAFEARVCQSVLGAGLEAARPARACRAGQEGGDFDATC